MYFAAIHSDTDPLLVALYDQAPVSDLSNHVERLYRLAVQGQFFHVRRHILLDRGLHLLPDLEEPVCGAEPFKALVRPAVVVVFHPVGEALLGFIERFKPGARKELALQRLPETFDFPESLRMMGLRTDMVDVISRQHLLELRLSAPVGVLPSVVGKKFRRHPVFPGCPPVHFQHVFSALAAIQPDPGDIPGMIIYKPDDKGWFVVEGEDRDVALPERIRFGVFVSTVFERLYTPFLLRRRDEPVRFGVFPDGGGAGPHEEQPPEHVGYLPRTMRRLRRLQFNNLRDNGLRQPALPWCRCPVLKSRLAIVTVISNPPLHRTVVDPEFPCDNGWRYSFLSRQLYGLAPYSHRVSFLPRIHLPTPRLPPGGQGGDPPCCLRLLLTHGFTPCHALTASGVLPSFIHSSFSLTGR